MAAVHLGGVEVKSLPGVAARPGGGHMRSSRQRRYLVGTSGLA
jgi:hypothetical protein